MLFIWPNDYVLHISFMQCAKQPYGSLLCGFYACEFLRACSKYSTSWRQLKKSQQYWEKKKVDEKNHTQTVAEICKCIMDDCVDAEGKFFYAESELGSAEKYEKLCNWRTMLNMKDYTLPDIF